jgi:hypothetical protein
MEQAPMLEGDDVAKFIESVLNGGSTKWLKNDQEWLSFNEVEDRKSEL